MNGPQINDDLQQDAIKALQLLPVSELLHPPLWLGELKVANFANLTELEDVLLLCEDILQQELESKVYNTFSSFLRFYEDYKQHGQRSSSVVSFVSSYCTELNQDGLSCVGMALSLLTKLQFIFPWLADSFALVSCEEVVDDIKNYCIYSPNAKKEHVLVAIRILLDQDRSGIVLFDPGYHLSRPITVMKDRRYPHTGWFTQSKVGKAVKEYNYEIINNHFVSWRVKEHKNGQTKEWSNLIYVRQAFAKSIEITEKRSLIYNFKSLVIRNRKGESIQIFIDCC